jgi:hypothetical protein
MTIQTSRTSELANPIELSQQNMATMARGFERLRAFTTDYNQNAGKEVLDSSKIIAALTSAGAVNDAVLKGLSENEIAQITEQPVIVARALQKEFQKVEGETSREGIKRMPSRISVQTYPLDELIAKYDPSDFGSPVLGEIRRRVNDALGRNQDPRIVVFDDEGKVIVEPTLQLLKEAMQGDPDLKVVTIDGIARTTYRLGEHPQQVVSIHPITGAYLRSNGQDKDGLNWNNAGLECKQLLHLAVENGELRLPLSRRDLVYYHALAHREDGLAQLSAEFPTSAQQFTEYKILGDLPSLKAFRNSKSDREIDPSEVIKTKRY